MTSLTAVLFLKRRLLIIMMLHNSVISLTSVVADLQQEVKELKSKMASYPEPRLNDNPSTSDKQHHNNKLLQPSNNTLESDVEVIAENDFQLTKSQQRKLKKGSQTIPNSFPGITGESASGHSFRAASTIQQLRPVFIGNAHRETTEGDIRKHVTSIGLADGLSDVQTLPSTIAGRAAFCVTFNDHITEEKAYKCDWPNRVIVRPYRPPRKNIHDPGSNGRYNHRDRQGNGNKMALSRGSNITQNNNKRYNNKNNNNKRYNNNNNNFYSNNNSSNNKRYNQSNNYSNNSNLGHNNNIGHNNNSNNNSNNNNSNNNNSNINNSDDATYRYRRSYNHQRQVPSLPQWQPFYTGYNGQFMPLMNIPSTI